MQMKTVGLVDLLTKKDVNISSIFALKQFWRAGRSFVKSIPRKQSAFLWFCGTSGTFLPVNEEPLFVPRGSLAYIPQGSRYELVFHDQPEDISTVLIEFCLSDEEYFVLSEHIEVISSAGQDDAVTQLIEKIVSEYERPTKPWLSLRRDLFELLRTIAAKEEKKGIGHHGFKTIEKGIEYLKKDEKQELSVEELAQMCFVTPAYFRRLFREYAGMSPTEYRTHKKIERAKNLFAHSDLSVAEVSERLGYVTPSYFCRVFKRITGTSPIEYKKQKIWQ